MLATDHMLWPVLKSTEKIKSPLLAIKMDAVSPLVGETATFAFHSSFFFGGEYNRNA